ncbi:putative pterin-4-alpha-carbinolamine dehydratase [Chitiniphilus shinanonensis]|uniref:Putative pterin-4-alpha-carbinolamine dehydratase n=1 Tax=Chitiniphilus shinanonensis TaxID=553088 RepID=A0ABQ6BUM7_9NEIS|nr:4a-hydroxytetrahydrobiopterin dehydratase [Chitiniphilus shinanonensis]GLS04880.1 putative pterin-4-alpha-carbinolamine dehydratase [Chitiniphilus shinanonensis]
MSLATEHCQADAAALSTVEAEMLLTELNDWLIAQKPLEKTFRFKNFHETMAFANAVAWIAHQQDHHPDLEVSYSRCKVAWCTHSAGGLTRNDFICAARVDALQG